MIDSIQGVSAESLVVHLALAGPQHWGYVEDNTDLRTDRWNQGRCR